MTTLTATGLHGARDAEVHPATRAALRIGAACAVLTVATGAINSATGSGFACSTWPGCHSGQFVPPAELHQVIEFGHRLIAASCALTVAVAAVLCLRLPKVQRPARLLPWVAVAGIFGSALFGAMTVLDLGLAKPLSVLDLGCALATMTAMTWATLSLERGAPRWAWTPLSRLATGVVAGLVLLHLLGTTVAGPSSFTAVLGWPLWHLIDRDLSPALQVIRMVLAVAVAVGIAVLAWRGRHVPRLRVVLGVMVGLLVVHLATGRWLVAHGVTVANAALYGATAALVVFTALLAAGRCALDPH